MSAWLFVDRFLQVEHGPAIDLASGREVMIRPRAVAGRAEQEAWARRCATLCELSSPWLVPLVDFGTAGRQGHFEAYACRRAPACWPRRDARTADALVHAVADLRAHGLPVGPLDWPRVVDVDGRPLLLPQAAAGEEGEPGVADEDSPAEAVLVREAADLSVMLRACGAASPGRRWPQPGGPARARPVAVATWREIAARIDEVLDTGVSGRPRALEVAWPGAGGPPVPGTVINIVARVSRLRGYIPVHASVLRGPASRLVDPADVKAVLHGRHVAVLDGGPHGDGVHARAAAAELFVALGLDSDRPHLLLALRGQGPRYPVAAGGDGAAARARWRAREREADYAGPSGVSLLPPAAAPAPGRSAWTSLPGGSCLERPRSRIVSALESATRGRHADAVRALREALGMLSRRNDWPGAAQSALELGRVMLARGQVREAGAMFEQARALFERARLISRSIEAAVFIGLAWTDAGRWLEAEAALRAAGISARTIDDGDEAELASLALGRCLLWQRRHGEALDALPPEAAVEQVARVAEAPPFGCCMAGRQGVVDRRVARAALVARIALARDDLRAAGAAAASARERASLAGRPAEQAIASAALAGVFAALGDTDSLRRQVGEGLDAARLAHLPLMALRLRTTLAEGFLRAGRATEVRSLVARLALLDLDRLPVVVRQPIERVLQSRRAASGDTRRAAGTPPAPARAAARADIVEVVVEILGLCQSVDDEPALLQRVMSTVRGRTKAAVAACFGVDAGLPVPLGSEGRDPPPAEVAGRAASAGVVIAPSATTSGLEAAVPVQFGGKTIGAVSCRWPADVPPAWSYAGAILAAAAAALAPCLRAVLDRRAVPAAPPERVAEEIVGASEAIRALREEILRAAHAPFNVVIEGESGTGKELVARAIHRLGPRRHRRLCAVNCAALTDELLEAELFGHARGAFTGAVAERKGLFEEADGGSLVLDEVGELSPRAQAKLLRAVQEGEVRRLGENFCRPIDVRIVAASNRPLGPAAAAGAFRRDLLYRLEVIRILVPPLRERVDDIPLLAAHFWREATARLGSRATLSPGALAALARYDWPGNVRELQNVLAALAVAAGRRGSVGPERLPAVIAGEAATGRAVTLENARRVFEVRFVRAALARAGGQRSVAARDLGLSRQGLSKLLARLEIDQETGVPAE